MKIQLHPIWVESATGTAFEHLETAYIDPAAVEMCSEFKDKEAWVLVMRSGYRIAISAEEFIKYDLLNAPHTEPKIVVMPPREPDKPYSPF